MPERLGSSSRGKEIVPDEGCSVEMRGEAGKAGAQVSVRSPDARREAGLSLSSGKGRAGNAFAYWRSAPTAP